MTTLPGRPRAGEGLPDRAGRAFAGYREGDVAQMDELVELLTGLLWHTARGAGLDERAAQDVVQTAWLRLVEHADSVADPQAVLGWLLSTVRRESWRVARTTLPAVEPDETRPDEAPHPDQQVETGDQLRLLWQHVQALPPRCRALLRVIAFAERPDYARVAAALGMPVGSIGPTRGRCLARLRTALAGDERWADVPGGAA
ncbi:RNA polymerase sigma factor [Auraticoccus monumenti]|uniref:RNA polymerase sigma factor, sigma-70 family n=1 Tax=Auraticoccus monumenti TaxID=675864 RepID=A0A1G6TN06_9ACTN|nr:sigma-70 family RNA polymerase sigma factor [Auraticoccus monumenti]SDD30483.1 RNA polymerase sigma factor, sigma-70 family [Auraticoccus monumenti]